MSRMTRAQIEQWYAKQKLPRKKGIIFRAIEDNGRLILGTYKNRERIGIYVLNADGRHAVKRKDEPWSSGGTYTLFDWSWYWGSSDAYREKEIHWADEQSKEIGVRLLSGHKSYWENVTNIVRRLQHIEEYYNERQRTARRMRKEKKIQDLMDSLPELPKDLYKWVQRTVFNDAHYMFGKKGCDEYCCTACGEKHVEKGLKDRQRTVCQATGKRVKVEKRTHIIDRSAKIQVIQSMEDGSSAVARHIEVYQQWSVHGITTDHAEQMVLFLPKDGRTPCHQWYYHVIGGYGGAPHWVDTNKGNYHCTREYLYPDTVKEALSGTVYERLALDVAAFKGWEMNYNKLMMAWRYGQTEYLIKGGFRQLVREIADLCAPGHYAGCICEVGSNVQETLMLDGQRVARLRQADGGIGYLRWLRTEEKTGEKLSEEVLRWLGSTMVSPRELDFIAPYMSYTRIANYLRSQMEKSKLRFENILVKWRDYMRMAEQLHMDIKKEAVYRPKDLRAAHDGLTEIINLKRDELERERIEGEYPLIAPTCNRIKPLYEWTDGVYSVTVPQGASDIIREGRLQNHCVGGANDLYFDRIATGESYIMFLRKSSAPETPWYTMEVEPGGNVRQLRTLGDNEGADRAEAKGVLSRWKKEIKKRLQQSEAGKAEIAASDMSREKRLLEFEELRRNGNIIRNGRLAGRLLVEVLEADFKECNEEHQIQALQGTA